jgi:hypothetical protein
MQQNESAAIPWFKVTSESPNVTQIDIVAIEFDILFDSKGIVKPGVQEFFDFLNATNISIGLVTTKRKGEVNRIIHRNELNTYKSLISCPETFILDKMDPDDPSYWPNPATGTLDLENAMVNFCHLAHLPICNTTCTEEGIQRKSILALSGDVQMSLACDVLFEESICIGTDRNFFKKFLKALKLEMSN